MTRSCRSSVGTTRIDLTDARSIGRSRSCLQSQLKEIAWAAAAPCSWTPEESEVESCEHQDNANIRCQPFPESVSEEHEIYADYDGCHRHRVNRASYLSAQPRVHFS